MSEALVRLVDKMAQAIRNDRSAICDRPWADLTDEQKAGWRDDARRALACIRSEVSDILYAARAAEAFVSDLPIDDAGSPYVTENNNGPTLDDLVYAVGNLAELALPTTTSELTPNAQFECPINYPGCAENCGSYGCGN